ncbi:MAG: thiamine diphosphokinase [Chloroflexi bacterium]|nr:thiamine diphosphokinase [Chloroflexota bacterium]
MSGFKKAIVVANGTPQMGQAVRNVVEHAADALIICADGGADVALKMGLRPYIIVGDMDSIDPNTLDTLESAGAELLRFPPDKDETDLELALLEATEHGASDIFILAAMGARIDHTLSNLYLLTLPAMQNRKVRLVDNNQSVWVIQPGTHPLSGAIGDTVSLLPFQGDAQGITTYGLQYPLSDETLYLGPARGVSNVIISPEASVTFKSGTLLIIHTIGHA